MKRLFMDVREPEEYENDRVNGAINIPLTQLHDDVAALKEIPKDAELVVYCRSGNRSNVAIQILKERGYTNLTNGINSQEITANFKT